MTVPPAQRLAFDVPALKSDANNGYLVTLVDQAKVDGGRTLPLVDSQSLATAKEEIEAGGRGLDDLAFKNLHSGNLEHAKTLASQALSRNPSDLVARAILDDIAKRANGTPAAAASQWAPLAVKPPDSKPVVSEPGDLNLQVDNGVAATKEIKEGTALEVQWQKDVQSTINQARSSVDATPDVAAALIRNKSNDLLAETALGPEMHDRLLGMLRAASREIQKRTEENTAREQQRIREEMRQREMSMANRELQREQDKVDLLMKRFEVLLAEGRGHSGGRGGRRGREDRRPLSAVVRCARGGRGRLPLADRLRRDHGRPRAETEALRRYPVPGRDAAYSHGRRTADRLSRCRNLEGARRRGARKGTDPRISRIPARPRRRSQRPSSSRRRSNSSDTPLKDVIDYLKDLHHVEIQLDGQALKDAGIEESVPITKNLKGISLRSALKLLLDDLELKYVVHNEVLLITTPARIDSEDYLTNKVYPVADLVLPIKETGFKGGFGPMGGGNMLGGGNQTSGNNPFGGNPMGNNNMGNMPGNGNPMGNGFPQGNNGMNMFGSNPMGNNFF